METSAEPGLPGTVLEGRYQVGSIIARGGMSTVYRGVDTRLGRNVAIKVMKPEFVSDPSFLARFEREARSAATLDHTGVVAVYDQGRDGEHVFLVMELVDGGTLRDVLREHGSLSVPVALSILEPVLSALGAAHSAGLVHRDVKPENVLISTKGEVKVADFGLVRAVSSMTMATGDVILGTVAYLSPEQVSTGRSDERSDVYAAGILAYEMFTGRPPFAGENAMSVAYQHVHTDVPAPSLLAPGVPHSIDEMIMAATSRNADLRPVDANAFLAESLALRAELGIRRVLVPAPTPRPVRGSAGGTGTGTGSVSRSTTAHTAGPTGTRVVPGAARDPGHPTTVGHPTLERPGSDGPGGTGPRGTGAGTADLAAVGPDGAPGRSRTPATAVQRRRRRIIIAWVLVVLIGLGAAFGGWWLGSGRWTSMPTVIGQSADSAAAAVRDADLAPVVVTELDDQVPAGAVVTVIPDEGSRQLRNSNVQLVVSAGRPKVPALEPGTDPITAAQKIKAASLTPVSEPTDEVYNDSVAAGTVVTTRPVSGTPVKLRSTVNLVLSKGPQPLAVPEVTGKSIEDAQNKLIAAGFTIGAEQRRFDPQQPADAVLGTDPAAGVSRAKGSEVSLVVSNSLTVPYTLGQTADSARTELESAGFTVLDGGTEFSSAYDAGTVVSTDPPSRTLVDPSTPTVRMVLSNAVTLPDVRGRSIDESAQILGDLGLQVDTHTPWFSGSTTRSQDPAAGTRVEPGASVSISTRG
ncbi:Stk1 family PASTA domain-containing Ser/Thr kinase [Nakamurella silvestris]|nr:Stk1 family PASTA domain-containing Ser/Thr kinase [Nakamurella silvestris]